MRWLALSLSGLISVAGLFTGCDDGGTTAPPTPTVDAAVGVVPPDAARPDDARVSPDACVVGSADCACDADGACSAGLFCAGGVCRAPACDLGDEGCLCFADDTCRTGPDGRPMACVDGRCRVAACRSPTRLRVGSVLRSTSSLFAKSVRRFSPNWRSAR